MLTIVGLGPGSSDLLSQEAKDALSATADILLRTERHPTVTWLIEHGLSFRSYDALYATASDFETLYQTIATDVLARAFSNDNVVYAVPGHPLFGEDSVSLILAKCRSESVPFRVVTSAGFIEPVMEAAGIGFSEGLQVWDAYSIERFRPDPRVPQLIYQVDSPDTASAAKLTLASLYPPEHHVVIVSAAGTPDQQVTTLPLFELDRHEHDHLTSVVVPPMQITRPPGLYGLVDVVRALRAPGGCPWDREQTHETLKPYLVEETYEALEAIDSGDPAQLCEEFGDVMLQVLLHAEIASESGLFDIEEVAEQETEKLIRRHPHVFADVKVSSSDEALANWQKIKAAEKADGAERTSALQDLPNALPALMRAAEISKRAARVGFEWPNIEGVFEKLAEETAELRAAINAHDSSRIGEELGDMLFTLVNLARHLKVDPEESLRQMTGRFIVRFVSMEREAASTGRELSSLSVEEWEGLWQKAKSSCPNDSDG